MNETGTTYDQEFVFRRLSDTFPFVSPEASSIAWWIVAIGAFLLGVIVVGWMYTRDSRTCRWFIAVPLALLRLTVYLVLLFAFLLPAKQTWETVQKTSRVVVLIDISPSVTQISDELSAQGKGTPTTRIQKIVEFLSDERIAFLKSILAKNPIQLYRFGTRLDEDSATINPDDSAWAKSDWDAWTSYDFKPWFLRGVSKAGKDLLQTNPAWNGVEPGPAEWALAWSKLPDGDTLPTGLSETDRATIIENRGKTESRVDLARSIIQGTNVPDSIIAAINRESANMPQALIVFSDGKSNLGSSAAFAELKERATREKLPVFTIVVGEARETIAIRITDVQAPDRAPPDEPFKVNVEADGIGLTQQEVDVRLSFYLPEKDPKTDAADHELLSKLVFQQGEPPHGQCEFIIDADTFPEAMTEEAKREETKLAGKRKQLKQGAWQVVARINRDSRELFTGKEHASSPRTIQISESPLRILMWASGPTREYQTLRTLLMREVNEKRAELSIFLQNVGGTEGNIVQDVAPDRLLIRFPTRFDVTAKPTDKPEDKIYNLHEYDVILAFDPDWSELSASQVEDLRAWVMDGGGGFLYVGGPFHTYQLARADESGRLKPLLQMLSALPDDIILLKTRATPRKPSRLKTNPNVDFDVLKLDDTLPEPDAGWEQFFTGREKYVPNADNTINLNPKNGFYSYYPLKDTKPGAAVLLEFLEANDRGEAERKPFLVANQPGRGRTAFLGSGEMWRLRAVDPSFYERFWIRLARNLSSARRNVQSFRGQVLVNKEYTSGSMLRIQARLLAPNARPYPPDAINPKFKVEQYDGSNAKIREFGPFPLAAKKGPAGFDGYYSTQIIADAKQFPPGDFRYKVLIDVPDSPGDVISGEFTVRKSDPELDSPRPDLVAMQTAATTLEDLRSRISDPTVFERLKGTATDASAVKLSFALRETEKLRLIPECVKADRKEFRNRGPVEDLWDKGFELPSWFSSRDPSQPAQISYLLLIAIGLLSIEWAVRKLVRLA